MSKQDHSVAHDSELGKKSLYESTYNPDRLYPISRGSKRQEIGIQLEKPPFYGFDYWTHYEVSWLNEKGKPMVGIAEIIYDCHSPKLVESKSLKLYFNSFNNTKVDSIQSLESMLTRDISQCIEDDVMVRIFTIDQTKEFNIHPLLGESIDALDVECTTYSVEPTFLTVSDEIVSEILCSDLLKSNCLVTHQPDWASLQIKYIGKKINREGLLKYIVSFRNHSGFSEHCVERIFVDIMNYCKPNSLTIYGRYTRRGGVDINPYRSTEKAPFTEQSLRLVRQ